jgi:LysM repeat protein
MKPKYWIAFVVLNIAVSAVTTLALLTYWDRAHPQGACEPTAQAAAPLTPAAAHAAAMTTPRPTSASLAAPLNQTTYLVQSGDTLSAISRRFNVSLDDLLAANNLTEDSILHVGQKIVVPTGGQPLATATLAPTPTATPSELAPPATATSIEIRQVIARGDPTSEAVVIANRGRQVNLHGWKISDNEGYVYTFPDLTLWPGGTITVHTGSGPDSVSDLYWERIAPVWAEPSDVVTLTDANGNVVARYQLP